MILNDKAILAECPPGKNAKKMVMPFVNHQEGFPSYGLGPAGYDIRLGPNIQVVQQGATLVPGMEDSDMESVLMMQQALEPGSKFIVWAGTTVMVESRERFKMPTNVRARIASKSTYSRLGLMLSTAEIEPGWKGRLKFMLVNPTTANIVVIVGAGIAQIIFDRIEEPDTAYEGHYQEDLEEETEDDAVANHFAGDDEDGS